MNGEQDPRFSSDRSLVRQAQLSEEGAAPTDPPRGVASLLPGPVVSPFRRKRRRGAVEEVFQCGCLRPARLTVSFTRS